MAWLKLWCLIMASVTLAGCGGASANGGSASGSATTASYDFVVPPVNSQRVYGRTMVDNFSNTTTNSFTETVVAANADGTFQVLREDPDNDSFILHGIDYASPSETLTNNSSGQTLSYLVNGIQITCTYSPHGGGPTYPVSIGVSWSIAYTNSCDEITQPTYAYQQTGSVIDVESVTVPAGTFSALKLQSTVVWTDSQGMIHNQAITNWRDTATGVSVMQAYAYTYGGRLSSNAYPVSETIVLQSGAP